MRLIYLLLSGVAFCCGLLIFTGAQSAIHEIEGLLLFLIAAVLFSALGVIEAVFSLRPKESTIPVTPTTKTESQAVENRERGPAQAALLVVGVIVAIGTILHYFGLVPN